MSIMQPVCVFVSLGILHAMQDTYGYVALQ
jgi:hypothetical protein